MMRSEQGSESKSAESKPTLLSLDWENFQQKNIGNMRMGTRKGKMYSKNRVLLPYDFPKIKIIIECIN